MGSLVNHTSGLLREFPPTGNVRGNREMSVEIGIPGRTMTSDVNHVTMSPRPV